MKDLYFIDETTKTIFALVELQGKVQMDLLGIERIHYINRDISKNWYEETKNKIKIKTQQLKIKGSNERT